MMSFLTSFSNKTGLGYTRESSSAMNISKEVKFVKAKEPIVVTPTMEKAKVEKKKDRKSTRLNSSHSSPSRMPSSA